MKIIYREERFEVGADLYKRIKFPDMRTGVPKTIWQRDEFDHGWKDLAEADALDMEARYQEAYG